MTANVIPGLEAPAEATLAEKIVGPVLVVTQGPAQPGLPTHRFLIDLAKRFEESEPGLSTRISCVASHLTLFEQAHESLRDQLQRKSAEVDQLRKELGAFQP